MPNVVEARHLLSLDRVIVREKLHSGDARDPVYPVPLLKRLDWWYGLTAEGTLAITQRWRDGREHFTDVSFNRLLREPEWTAENRHAIAHEWCHVWCNHPDGVFIMWRNGRGPDPFARFIDSYLERQCEYLSAYLLIRRALLLEMWDATCEEIAAVADVPVHLVPLRWHLWGKHHR